MINLFRDLGYDEASREVVKARLNAYLDEVAGLKRACVFQFDCVWHRNGSALYCPPGVFVGFDCAHDLYHGE